MEPNAKVICFANQKGGTAKTTSTIAMGAALTQKGYKVLLVDFDSQASLSISLGIENPDSLNATICDLLNFAINEQFFDTAQYILHHAEGFDFIPANIDLAAMDVYLINVSDREYMLRRIVDQIRSQYDFILIDCMPSLGMLTINALSAADSVIIPVQSTYLSAKAIEQLLKSIGKVRKQINPMLSVEGVLITLVDKRTNYAKNIISLLIESYGSYLHVFRTTIPLSVRAAETSASGSSIFAYDPNGKVAMSYLSVCEEVLSHE